MCKSIFFLFAKATHKKKEEPKTMEYGIIIAFLLITFLVMAWALQVKPKDLQTLKKIGFDETLAKKAEAFPNNETICKEMLEMLGNKEVQIKVEEGGKEKTSLYIVATNTIWIANIQNTFTRIQTIAHECLHSVQNKITLWFQFLLSSIYPIYFILISILTILGIAKHTMIHTVVLLLLGILFFTIRAYLEMEAMLKARQLARDYMQTKPEIASEQIKPILEGYDKINALGIKLSLLQLWAKPILRTTIYCLIVIFV